MVTSGAIHHMKRGARVRWRCRADGCAFTCDSEAEAVAHSIANQWQATRSLPPELQLTPEQAAVTERVAE